MIIRLTRSSVAMGDDVDAPHAWELNMEDSSQLRELLFKVKEQHYLASIGSGKATWVPYLEDMALAVVAQQWEEPNFLINDSITMAELFDGHQRAELHFRYLAQQDPHEVVHLLKQKK